MLPALEQHIETCKPVFDQNEIEKLYANNDFEGLMNAGLRLVRARANIRYFPNGRFTYDDIFSAGIDGLQWAITSYNKEKGKYSVWIYRAIDGYMLNATWGAKYENNTTAAEGLQTDSDDDGSVNLVNNIEDERPTQEDFQLATDDSLLLMDIIFGEIPSDLSDLEKNVLILYFGLIDDKRRTMDECAEKLNYSKPGIKAILDRSLAKLKPFFKK